MAVLGRRERMTTKTTDGGFGLHHLCTRWALFRVPNFSRINRLHNRHDQSKKNRREDDRKPIKRPETSSLSHGGPANENRECRTYCNCKGEKQEYPEADAIIEKKQEHKQAGEHSRNYVGTYGDSVVHFSKLVSSFQKPTTLLPKPSKVGGRPKPAVTSSRRGAVARCACKIQGFTPIYQ